MVSPAHYKAGLASAVLVVLANCAGTSTGNIGRADTICTNRTGIHDGYFFTFWKSSGNACMTLGEAGRYTSAYRLKSEENLVLGKGWQTGGADRVIAYEARFTAGTNSYLTLYGWSREPLVEYYIVDNWGSNFTPPGPGIEPIGMLESDGGVYRIYRTKRVQQPSIDGTATFDQYWSVRTLRRPAGEVATITFANHVTAWRNVGMQLGKLEYQVLATEGFGSDGQSDITVYQWPTLQVTEASN